MKNTSKLIIKCHTFKIGLSFSFKMLLLTLTLFAWPKLILKKKKTSVTRDLGISLDALQHNFQICYETHTYMMYI